MCLRLILFLTLIISTSFSKPLVVVTTSDLADIARKIAGDELDIKGLASGVDNLHDIESRPSFVVLLSRASALLINGADLDFWIDPAIANSRNYKIQPGSSAHLNASKWVTLLEVPTGFIDRAFGADIHASGNPHYLMNPRNGLRVASRLSSELSRIFPSSSERFTSNLSLFSNELTSRMDDWKKRAVKLQGVEFVCYHEEWRYFADFFEMRDAVRLEPKPGIPPTPSHLNKVVETIKMKEIPFVIRTPNNEKRPGDWVAAKSGARHIVLAAQVGSLPEARDYFELFENNLKILLSSSN